ncbi:MAG: alcohol dehydrogenase catalytic domain-containing protein, partial [Clostridiales bacterium]|nr:alcohol dehydrogenase catalytic domain-containing protein [Clostridiales bacterium]
MKIKAAIIYKPNDPYVIDDVDLDKPKAGEALVRVVACGYCNSDHAVAHGEFKAEYPIVLGHEGCGIVEEVGEGVKDFKPGDRVCMSYSYCGECYACITGRPYQCEANWRLNFGGRAYDGTARLTKDGKDLESFFNQSAFATYSVTHQNNLVHVPEEIDLRLVGPLGCGIQTGAGAVLNVLKPEAGSSIIVVGLGGVGMSGLMAAKACGCSTIIG